MKLTIQQSDLAGNSFFAICLDSEEQHEEVLLHLRWSEQRMQQLVPFFGQGESAQKPADIWLEFRFHQALWQVNYRIELAQKRVCGRCGEAMNAEVNTRGCWHLKKEPETTTSSNSAGHLKNTYFVQEAVLDLEAFLIDLLAESGDPYPVCRQDCAGLCPYCGHNLNHGSCECHPEPAGALARALAKSNIQSAQN